MWFIKAVDPKTNSEYIFKIQQDEVALLLDWIKQEGLHVIEQRPI